MSFDAWCLLCIAWRSALCSVLRALCMARLGVLSDLHLS